MKMFKKLLKSGVNGFCDNENPVFIHKTPKIRNLGDELCSPKHYYNFEAPDNAPPVAIIGGGAFKDLGINAAKKRSGFSKITWGIGTSLTGKEHEKDTQNIDTAKYFSVASTRDPWLVNSERQLVPCSSVHHEICDLSPGKSIGLFLNAAPQASGEEWSGMIDSLKEKFPDVVIMDNSMSLDRLLHLFSQVDRVVTNSYHGAYWSLLSGRAITLIGYSSKFTSLIELFGMDSSLVRKYERGESEMLFQCINQSLEAPMRFKLSDSEKTKKGFREINNCFAQSLVDKGIFKSVLLKSKDF